MGTPRLNRDSKNILSLCGGGTHGVGQAKFLQMLEADQGGPLAESFDLVTGTSVGCINGAYVAAGLSAAPLLDFFYQQAPSIFSGGKWAFERLLASAEYAPAALERALRDVLGDRGLGDCRTRFLATALAMQDGSSRNVYFQSYGTSSADEDEVVIAPDTGIKLWEVCRASSAAQSYFPGFQWTHPQLGPMVFWDGGTTGCNAPDMLAVAEAYGALGWPLGGTAMLSLGNGRSPWPWKMASTVNPSFKEVLEMTLDRAYRCAEAAEVWQARALLGERHTRVNPPLARDYGIDDAAKADLDAQCAVWEAAYAAAYAGEGA